MADASRTGGGKSISIINTQRKRMMIAISQQIKAARAQGNTQLVNQLEARKNRIESIAGRYTYNILRRQQENNGGNRYQLSSRSVYTNGQMGGSRAGQIGQFRAGKNTYRSFARRNNQYQSGIKLGYAMAKQGTAESRKSAASFASRNQVMKAGVKKGVSSGYRSQTNNKQALESRKRRNGKGYRVKSNATNAKNSRLSELIRLKRRERKRAQKNGQQIFQ